MALFGSFNQVVIMGNMTRDVEARTLPSGKRVANVTIAIGDRVKRGDQWEDDTTFVDVTVWDKQVEFLERFGGKGKCVLVQGRLRQEKWVDKQSGQNRSKMVVVAENLTFQSGSGGGNGGGGGGGASRDNNRARGGSNGGQQGRGSTGGMPYAQNVDDVGGWGDGGGGYDDYDGGDYPGEGGYNAPAGKGSADAPPWQS